LLDYALPSAVYHRTSLSDEDNAYPYWERATRTFVELSADEAPLDLADEIGCRNGFWEQARTDVQIAHWLSRYEPVLDLLDRAAAMDRLQLPPLPLDGKEWPQFSPWRSAGFLKILRAKQRASRNDWEGALRDIRDVLHLSDMLARGDAELIRFFVASAMRSSALTAARCLGSNPNAPRRTIDGLLLLVPDPKDWCEVWALVRRVEFTSFSVPTIAQLSETPWQRIGGKGSVHPNDPDGKRRSKLIEAVLAGNAHPFDLADTIHLASEIVQSDIDACSLPWDQARSSGATALPPATEAEELLDAVVLGEEPSTDEVELQGLRDASAATLNPLGRSWLRRFGSHSYVETLFRLRVGWRATHLLLLVDSYRRRRGTFPASLSEVTPPLSGAFVDLFSGDPFRYSRQRALLWSVGKNGRNDDGVAGKVDVSSTGETVPEDDDIVWSLIN
jgi:hypothetical protein